MLRRARKGATQPVAEQRRQARIQSTRKPQGLEGAGRGASALRLSTSGGWSASRGRRTLGAATSASHAARRRLGARRRGRAAPQWMGPGCRCAGCGRGSMPSSRAAFPGEARRGIRPVPDFRSNRKRWFRPGRNRTSSEPRPARIHGPSHGIPQRHRPAGPSPGGRPTSDAGPRLKFVRSSGASVAAILQGRAALPHCRVLDTIKLHQSCRDCQRGIPPQYLKLGMQLTQPTAIGSVASSNLGGERSVNENGDEIGQRG